MIDPQIISQTITGLRGSSHLRGAQFPARTHIQAAVDWMVRAYQAANMRGISKSYHLLRGKWLPAYPETTGYSIPTLLNAAEYLNRPDLHAIALQLAEFLLDCRTPDGGVAHWKAAQASHPVVFDTGQVMFGWLAAYAYSNDDRFLEAAQKAGDWLVKIQDPSGSWKMYQHLGVEKVIDTRVAWALMRLAQVTKKQIYHDAAKKNLYWAAEQQDPDGWFQHCAFEKSQQPVTHTLAYTAEGFLECGLLMDDDRLIETGKKTADALLRKMQPSGSIPGLFARGWQATTTAACLTGNCQISRIWLLLTDLTGKSHYQSAAGSALDFVKKTQEIRLEGTPPHAGITGGIAGSFPIYGPYERFQFPNWATKFFLDALLAWEKKNDPSRGGYYHG